MIDTDIDLCLQIYTIWKRMHEVKSEAQAPHKCNHASKHLCTYDSLCSMFLPLDS